MNSDSDRDQKYDDGRTVDDEDEINVNSSNELIFGSNLLCGMFKDPNDSKTDACALFCCGIFLWQRNRDLLNRMPKQSDLIGTSSSPVVVMDQSPSSLSVLLSTVTKRPFETGFVLLLLLSVVIWSIDPQNNFSFILHGAIVVLVACFALKVVVFQQERKKFRKQLAISEYHRRCRSDSDSKLELFTNQHREEIYGCGIHDIVGCTKIDKASLCRHDIAEEHSGVITIDQTNSKEEKQSFCLGAWRFLSNLCCGFFCGCNIQLFGICAIAQEHRHLKEVLPSSKTRPDLWQRDYITMQPWSEYYPSIIRLRLSNQTNFLSHLKAISTLSRRILISAAVFVILASLMVLLPIRFPKWQILLLYGTILQPVVFLAFVHWMWNRFDLSLDAVVKYIACGFFICTSTTIVYELAASKIAQKFMELIAIIGSEGLKLYNEHFASDNGRDVQGELLKSHYMEPPYGYEITIAVIGAFVQAFFVASCTEEFCKYLCFSMVEHPDLEGKVMLNSSRKPSDAAATDATPSINDDEESTRLVSLDQNSSLAVAIDNEITFAPTAPLVSVGEAITVAMIAVALGFACAENLLYVFVYTSPDLDSEISTLYVRCMFPIHPLCAAIQSIGVCRRDLEKNPSSKIGRIVFPAWIMHGCFDFALMANTAINKIEMRHKAYHPSGLDGEIDDTRSVPYLVYVMILPFLGMVYFLYESWYQRERLYNIDRNS